MEVRPVAAEINAVEILNCSVPALLASPAQQECIRGLLREHGFLLMRGVASLSPGEEEALMKLFPYDDVAAVRDVSGPYHAPGTGIIETVRNGVTVGAARWKIPAHPVIQLQGNGAVKSHYGVEDGWLASRWETREWHTDGCHDVPASTWPPVATSMYCFATPSEAGETLFASGRRILDALSEDLRDVALRLDAVYDLALRPMEKDGCRAARSSGVVPGELTNQFPIVILDQKRRPSLYVAPAFTRYLVDAETGERWTPEASQAFLGRVLRAGMKSIYAHFWNPNDFVVWDNRQMVHSATPSDLYEGQARLFHRVRMSSRVPIVAARRRDEGGDLSLYYEWFWALEQLLARGSILLGGSASLASTTGGGALVLLPLLLLPRKKNNGLPLRVSHALNLVVRARKLPAVWDYEFWAGLTDLSVLADALPALRAQWIFLYYATAFYKLTTSFLSTSTSCAPIFVLSLLDSVAPRRGPCCSSYVLRWLNRLSAPATIVVELAIPTLLWLRPPAGVILAAAFHQLIALAPPPNNAGGFSVAVAVRLTLFLKPREKVVSKTGALFALVFVTLATELAHRRGGDWPLAVATLMNVLLVLAALSQQQQQQQQQPCTRKRRFWNIKNGTLLALAFAYVALPILGLQDMGAPTMFANLRVYGGSNHVIAPTSLLVRPKLLRLEVSTSRTINEIHPNEVAHSKRLTAWLRTSGHSGRQFAPYVARAVGITFSPNRTSLATPLLLPDLELRRLLAEANANGETDYLIQYTKLPSGDRVFFDAATNTCVLSSPPPPPSSSSSSSSECAPDEPPLNPGLPWWQRKTLLFFSFPVDADARELGCVS
ncbi:hypothetical protein CTAYLR_009897 [Chrysophaeum taylorii]|uniref:TauD/TfdA-like domain-containing protein n=1 Tax=Chrysophaeum taylorii TaxID=2483200 RepID=A0AAD7UHZ6_9STRA|nr:hypothetical protein CTAYLR_009897 [Chrysophaeum taylorii]